MFDFLSKPKTAQEPVGLRQQIADWAVRLPPSWPSWARTSLVVAVMLIVGTLAVLLAPVLLFTLVYTATWASHHR
jgi:hypothetical protein